jgi:hypothetical protein
MERRAAGAERRLAELEARLAALTKLGGGAGAPAGASTAASAADEVSPPHPRPISLYLLQQTLLSGPFLGSYAARAVDLGRWSHAVPLAQLHFLIGVCDHVQQRAQNSARKKGVLSFALCRLWPHHASAACLCHALPPHVGCCGIIWHGCEARAWKARYSTNRGERTCVNFQRQWPMNDTSHCVAAIVCRHGVLPSVDHTPAALACRPTRVITARCQPPI